MAGAAEAESAVEEWVALTQNTLGNLISKPRMLAERLRKPPFRFLFDIAVEVARQTSFGIAELFGGEVGSKPAPPASRDDKVAFLERWRLLAASSLGGKAVDMARVSAENIVCGLEPEWTNFLLQCTAAAAWPSCCNAPAAPEEPVPQPAPQPAMTQEEARALADGMDFSSCFQEMNKVHEDFHRTVGDSWRPQSRTEDVAAAHAYPSNQADVPPLPRVAEDKGTRPKTSGQATLEKAAEVTSKVDIEMRKAQELLDLMDENLDRDEEELQKKRDQHAQYKAEVEADRQRQADADARLKDAIAREARTAEEEERFAQEAEERAAAEREEEIARRKAEKKAAKAKRRAEREKAKAMYPVSKTSQLQGARMVARLPENQADYSSGDDESVVGDLPGKAPSPLGKAAMSPEPEANTYVDAMSACFGDDLLGDKKDDKNAFDFSAAEARFHAQNGTTVEAQSQEQSPLFERLKTELQDTFMSYLTASMPESLLKKYSADEIIGCLQFLLQELRTCLKKNSLDDVDGEDPTTLSEELQTSFSKGWLNHLQGGPPAMLRQKHDALEVIDLLQSLAGTCVERLNDEHVDVTRWAPADSPLRRRSAPDLPPDPLAVPSEFELAPSPATNGFKTQSERRAGLSPSPGGFRSTRTPSPMADPALQTTSGFNPSVTSSRFQGTAQRPGRSASPLPGSASPMSPAPAPVFTAALAPAPWETGGMSLAPATAGPSSTLHSRMGTTSRTAAGPRPPLMASTGAGFSSRGHQQMMSTGSVFR